MTRTIKAKILGPTDKKKNIIFVGKPALRDPEDRRSSTGKIKIVKKVKIDLHKYLSDTDIF